MALKSIACCHDGVHLLGESTVHPIEPRCATLAALRTRAMPWDIAVVRALPAPHIAARSGAPNSRV
jgi:transposase